MSKALSCVTPISLAAPVVLSCAAGGGGGGLLLWQDWPPALALIVPYVPWVMALIGIAICLMYQRSQTMALMLSVLVAAAAWPALAEQAPWALGPALAWWALAYTINALWAERSSVLLDLTARLGLMASGAAAIALAGKEGTADFFSTLAVQGALARLGVPVEALAALLATGLTLTLLLLRYGRPQQAGQWLGFVCMAWALPRGAQHPIELALMSAAALTSLSISLAHEGFHMAFRDELTGLPGRRALNEKLQRMGRVYTLAMADVDHFKAFNDTHGHDVGDQVLRMVAAQLRRVSGGGHAYRYGGEEFTLVFPGKTAAESMPHLEAVRRAIEAYQMRLRDKPARPRTDQAGLRRRGARGGRNTRPLRVTVSIGVAERGDALRAPEAVIKAADQALYKAKDGGRNRCVPTARAGAPTRAETAPRSVGSKGREVAAGRQRRVPPQGAQSPARRSVISLSSCVTPFTHSPSGSTPYSAKPRLSYSARAARLPAVTLSCSWRTPRMPPAWSMAASISRRASPRPRAAGATYTLQICALWRIFNLCCRPTPVMPASAPSMNTPNMAFSMSVATQARMSSSVSVCSSS